MSLRDDFEKKFGPEPEEDKPYSDDVAHLIWTSQLEGYQAATERALRIVREEVDADYDDHRNRLKAVKQRINGES